jgi:hypothetical protein
MEDQDKIPTSAPVKEEDQLEVIPYVEPTVDPSKTGNKPKQLKAVEVYGYEIGRGLRKRIVPPKDVYELASIGCSDREIARWFDVDENTLRYNFSDILEKGREDLKHSLRRAQLKLALGGNAVMLIWLGKNLLGQSDNPMDSTANAPLPWTAEDQ